MQMKEGKRHAKGLENQVVLREIPGSAIRRFHIIPETIAQETHVDECANEALTQHEGNNRLLRPRIC